MTKDSKTEVNNYKQMRLEQQKVFTSKESKVRHASFK
jgi:hypothetical protein